MPQYIKGDRVQGARIVEDPFVRLADAAGLDAIAPGVAVIVPLGVLQADSSRLFLRFAPVGVVLEPDDDPQLIREVLGDLAVVAVSFPTFTDGRGYSTARLLRERYRYRGEVRAVGDVLRDQVFYLTRCGFDALEPRADQDFERILQAYRDFRTSYQGAVDDPRPLFRRRAEAARAIEEGA